MLSESLRQRLEALNRDRLPETAPRPQAARGAEGRRLAPVEEPPALGGAIAKPVVEANRAGEHLVYTIPVEQIWPAGPRLVAARLEHLASRQPKGDTAKLISAMPERAAMLDLETCGLSGAALFLIGLLRWIDGQPMVELLLARHYGEEPAVLASLWARLAELDVVVTFNGKSFDWPMVEDRSRRHLLDRQQDLTPPTHLDVLHAARRKWKAVLPDCRLQTIERLVCRRARGADIPGGQIPAAYDVFVRTGRDHEMRLILEHNALDLVTLLDIAMRVAE